MTAAATDTALDLLELARSQTTRDRSVLMQNMTDLFLSPEGRLTERDRTAMADIIGKLVDEVETTVRRKLAERLAVTPGAPRALVLKLSADEAGVAKPLLLASDVLKDADLVQLVKHRTQEHRLAIAMRAGIGGDVGDALIEHGEEDVIEALIRNKDAVLSRQAIDYLVEESRRIDRFQEPLLRRQDLPPALAMRMFWWVSAALRRQILSDFPIKAEDLDDAMEGAVHAGARNAGGAQLEAEKLASRLHERGELTPTSLLHSLRLGHVSAFVAGLARIAGVDYATTRRIVFAPGGEALAATCKAAGFYRSGFATAFLLLRNAQHPGIPLPPTVLEDLLATYDRADLERSRLALRHWMRDADYLAAIDALPAPVPRAAAAPAAGEPT